LGRAGAKPGSREVGKNAASASPPPRFPASPLVSAIALTNHPAFEQAPPLGSDRVGIAEKLLVHCLGEAGVRGFEDIGIHESHPALRGLSAQIRYGELIRGRLAPNV
jgi:hypothetical protein